ncbi:MAG: hypothetical protein ACW97Z_16905 [Candidatus Hodarchaeales archaeon]
MIKIAYSAGAAGTTAATIHTSSYRVKFRRKEFLDLVDTAQPRTVYRVKRIFFFSYDGFVMYTFECNEEDFINQTVIHAIEFSNQQWAES